jgi:glutamyl-tRNA reductase
VSISYAAVKLARKIFGDLSGKTVMIIGASKMGELAAKHLKRNGVSSVLVTNRTFERAVELAKVFQVRPFRLNISSITLVAPTSSSVLQVRRTSSSVTLAEQVIHRRKQTDVLYRYRSSRMSIPRLMRSIMRFYTISQSSTGHRRQS